MYTFEQQAAIEKDARAQLYSTIDKLFKEGKTEDEVYHELAGTYITLVAVKPLSVAMMLAFCVLRDYYKTREKYDTTTS